jgi:hypothetical protein
MAFQPFLNAGNSTLVGIRRWMRPVKDTYLSEEKNADA